MAVLSFEPKTKKFREDRDTFARLIGECITRWAFIDRELFRLCVYALGAHRDRVAIVYYRMQSISPRLSLTDDLLKSKLSPARLKEWDALRKRIYDRLATRNAIAHGPMKMTGTSKRVGKRVVAHYDFSVEPEPFNPKPKAPAQVTATQLRAHFKEAESLISDLRKFLGALGASRG